MKPELLKQSIADLITPALAVEGAFLVEMKVAQYKNQTTVRAFVYSDRGTTLGECARLSGIVGDLLDGTDWFKSGYTLEISSPGLDRPLTTPQDFRFRIGETVKVEFVDSDRQRLQAEIVAAKDEDVELNDGITTQKFKLSEIKQALIVY